MSVSHIVLGQDLIITKDARKIEAKVLEVNPNDIKYKLFSNLNGPVYTMPIQNIASVIYQNGSVETFVDTAPQRPTSSSNSGNRAIVDRFLKLSDNQQEDF